MSTPPPVPPPAPPQPATPDAAADAYRQNRIAYWDAIARQTPQPRKLSRYYHRRLEDVYRFVIPRGQRVLELGCGRGDLLAAVEPSRGVGVDFAPLMLAQARQRHPDLHFIDADALDVSLDETFDFIIISDLINDLWDVQRVLERLRDLCTPRTRVILNFYSRLWEWPLAGASRSKLAHPMLRQNWMTREDLANLLYIAGLEMMRSWPEVLWPLRTPVIDAVCNKFLVRFSPFKHLALTNFMLARPLPQPLLKSEEPRVSVVIAARNEAGNVAE